MRTSLPGGTLIAGPVTAKGFPVVLPSFVAATLIPEQHLDPSRQYRVRVRVRYGLQPEGPFALIASRETTPQSFLHFPNLDEAEALNVVTELQSLSIADPVALASSDAGSSEGELGGLDFPVDGFYYARVCQANDNTHSAGAYLFSVYVPAGLQGINIIGLDIVSGGALVGAQVRLRNVVGTLLGTQVIGPSGTANFSSFSPATYRVEVDAPDAGYVAWFDQQDVVHQPSNPFSDYGNPRWLRAADFGTVAYQGQILLQTTFLGFYFVPVARVEGRVTDTVFGPTQPVANAFVSLVRTSDGAVFDRFPWSTYGTVWWSDAGGAFPADVYILPQANYILFVQKTGIARFRYPLTIRSGARSFRWATCCSNRST